MAATTRPLEWDFYREISGATQLGGQIHYYDMMAQSLYGSSGGLTTTVSNPKLGDWTTTPSIYTDIINNKQFTRLRMDHPSNGTVYMATIINGELVFQRYVYMEDLTNVVEKWDIQLTSDSIIQDVSLSIMNFAFDMVVSNTTLFQPGGRILLGISCNESGITPMGVFWLDEVSADILQEDIPISGRNTIGYYLKDQTMDDLTYMNGRIDDAIKAILDHAGVTNYEVQTIELAKAYRFEPDITHVEAIDKICSSLNPGVPSHVVSMIELPDGKILVGTQEWLASKYPNGKYTFDEGSDVFTRNTTKMVDACYTQLIATGIKVKASETDKDEPLTPVTVPINNYSHWSLGLHRTKHLKAPTEMTQAELQTWAEAEAKKLQYVGIGEEFVSPFRPELIPKDLAIVKSGSKTKTLGLITEVRHSFDIESGYVTEFSVDSGGIEASGDTYTIYADVANLQGYNRKQKMIDIIRVVSDNKK